MRVTLVVSSLNEGSNLCRTVRSSLDTTTGLDREVLVADDDSHDGSLDELRHRFPDVRIVGHASRRGVASTKDLGARSALGDVLVFLDGHCKPEVGAIARLVEDVDAFNGRAIVTPAVAALNIETWENQTNLGHGYSVELTEFKCGWCDPRRLHRRGRFYESPALIGCCVAISRELYQELLGFDTGMNEWGSEDIDLGLRAWFMGSLILNDPDAVIGHRFRAAFDNFDVSPVQPLVNQLRMARKNFEDPIWETWVAACSQRYDSDFWANVWSVFEDGRERVEKDRHHVLAHKTRDEYWFADYFDLPWPRHG
jgi:GT2 family glycosyltransferase